MNDKIVKPDGSEIRSIQSVKELQNFTTRLNRPPKKDEIQINKYADNTKYLPISFLQMQMDEIFYGLWQTRNFQTQIVANEMCGSIELWFFHPIAETWLCRMGTAAVIIRFKKDSEVSDVNNKITNALTMDYPHLEAMCFRNAVGKLGQYFGRDLNRKFTDSYDPVVKVIQLDERFLEVYRKIDSYPTADKLAKGKNDIIAFALQKGFNAVEVIEIQDYINSAYRKLKEKGAKK